MAKFGFLKRLVKEDFKKEDQAIIDKIAFILNPALESLTQALSNNLTFEENLNAQVKELELIVGSNGIPTSSVSFSSTLKGTCKGLMVVRVENLTNSVAYPSGAPFISFSDNAGQITINHITGLTAGNKYRLRVIATV